MKRLKIDLGELELAFEGFPSDEVGWYLDTETGAVISLNLSAFSEMEEIVEEIGEGEARDRTAFVAALDGRRLMNCEPEEVIAAFEIESAPGGRYNEVPRDEGHVGYGDMEAFIESMKTGRVRDRLSDAISRGRPFRRFKDVLAQDPEERERWFAFRDSRVRERIIEWLRE